VWSRNCRSCSRNRTRVAELKHHAERVRHLTINRWGLPCWRPSRTRCVLIRPR
jgi:hypothetical protein